MAGKAKSVYLTVADSTTHKSVFHKVFFNANEFREYIKTEEFKEKYPEPQYYVVKETI